MKIICLFFLFYFYVIEFFIKKVELNVFKSNEISWFHKKWVINDFIEIDFILVSIFILNYFFNQKSQIELKKSNKNSSKIKHSLNNLIYFFNDFVFHINQYFCLNSKTQGKHQIQQR